MPSKSDTHDQIARAVGNALSSWTNVELALDNVFSIVSGMERQKAHILMATIVSFETRLAVCNAMVRADKRLEDVLPLWNQVAARTAKAYKSRHQIAHFTILSKSPPDEPEAKLVPFFTFGALLIGKNTELGVAEIKQKQDRFNEIATALNWFWFRRMNKGRGLEGHELNSDLIRRLQSQAAQNPAETPPPPQSSEG